MIALIQRVTQAKVEVEGQIMGQIGKGLLVLLGVEKEDDQAKADKLAEKVLNYRIFSDENDKMNLSVKDVKGGVLFVPNFTLYGDARHGRRPGYTAAAVPEKANFLFEELKIKASQLDIDKVEFGIFQADMKVELLNDGPITLLLDSAKNF